jgi:hypothetical protein
MNLQTVNFLVFLLEEIGSDRAREASVIFSKKRFRRIGVETRLKGYKYFEIERDFFNKLGVLIDGDFKDVLDKLSDVGKKDQLLKFFKLVQDGKFPFNNIAFELFLDIVEWLNIL